MSAWNKTGEIAQKYLTKGSKVMIEGKIYLNTYTSSEGQEKSNLSVLCQNLEMLGGQQSTQENNHSKNEVKSSNL